MSVLDDNITKLDGYLDRFRNGGDQKPHCGAGLRWQCGRVSNPLAG